MQYQTIQGRVQVDLLMILSEKLTNLNLMCRQNRLEEARQCLAWLREGEHYLEEEHEILEVGAHFKSGLVWLFSLKVCTEQADSGVGMFKGLRSPSPSFHINNQNSHHFEIIIVISIASYHKRHPFDVRVRAGLLITKRFLHPMMIAGPLVLMWVLMGSWWEFT